MLNYRKHTGSISDLDEGKDYKHMKGTDDDYDYETIYYCYNIMFNLKIIWKCFIFDKKAVDKFV